MSGAISQLAAFLAVSAVVICSPGQDTALTIRNTLAGGRRAGLATGAGVALGQLAWTIATAAGIASLVAASRPAFLALQLLGAAYLVLLGLRTIALGLRRRPLNVGLEPSAATARDAMRQGLLSNLANPKMAVFFVGLLPQFSPGGSLGFPALFALGLLFCLLTFGWLCLYSLGVARLRRLLLRERVRRLVETAMGTVLVALGVRLAAQRS